MGWSGGGELLREIISIVDEDIAPQRKKVIYKRLIDAFEWHDADTLDECMGISEAFDDVYVAHVREHYDPDWEPYN